jgi:alkylation response protein AidB-like acyl-CoA dehydrogenase
MTKRNATSQLYSEVRNTVRKLLAQELLPKIDDWETKGEFARPVLTQLAKLGLAAPMLPEPYGMDDLMAQAVVAEEMGYVSSGFGLSTLASVDLFGYNIGKLGTEEQKKKYLPGIVSGEKIGCWALTEPEVGSDAAAIKTKCKKVGNDFVINGSKTFITNAPIADYFIVIAKNDDGKTREATAFILERKMAGLKTGKPFHKLGHLSSPTGEIFLENVKVPSSQILGNPKEAFKGMKASLDVERAIFSALAIGMIQFCLDTMVKYGTQRKQFGVPILNHQMMQEKVADVSAKLDVIRTYSYDVIKKLASGLTINKEAAILKLLASQWVFEAANHAVQSLGGYGYMKEYHVERFLRDAKLFEIGGGTSEIQKLIIAKQTIKQILEP